ncbi:MAG: YitT family protein, partial [Bacteroidaceae bacterium]|nr:YitT family protein [Bacteroidaceae bacterium]
MTLPHVTRHDVTDFLKDLVMINIGMAIYDVGWAAFLLPYQITTGGMAGAAAVLEYATSFPMQTTILLVNAVLMLIAWWQLGTKFTLKTAIAVFALVGYLSLGRSLMTQDNGQLYRILGDGQESMACVLGAVLNGIGIGIIFTSGGCTGGWDIVAAVVNKHRNISLGRVMMFMDFFVISSGYFVFNDLKVVVLGFVTLILYTTTLDMVVNSSKQDIQITIYTKHHLQICEAIRELTGHTTPLLWGEGGYSHQEMKIEVVIVHKREV